MSACKLNVALIQCLDHFDHLPSHQDYHPSSPDANSDYYYHSLNRDYHLNLHHHYDDPVSSFSFSQPGDTTHAAISTTRLQGLYLSILRPQGVRKQHRLRLLLQTGRSYNQSLRMHHQLRTRRDATGPGHGELPGSLRPIHSSASCHRHQVCGAHPHSCIDTRRRTPTWNRDPSPSFPGRGWPDHHSRCTGPRQPCTNSPAIQQRPINHDSGLRHRQHPLLRRRRHRQPDHRRPGPGSDRRHGPRLHNHLAAVDLARRAPNALRDLRLQRRARGRYPSRQRSRRDRFPCVALRGRGCRCGWHFRQRLGARLARTTGTYGVTVQGCGRQDLAQRYLPVRGACSRRSRCLRISASLCIMMATVGSGVERRPKKKRKEKKRREGCLYSCLSLINQHLSVPRALFGWLGGLAH